MSLRGRARDVVMVQKRAARPGKMGQDEYADDGEPIAVRCNVYPLTSAESESLGLVNSESRQVFLHQGTWPGDQFSQLTFEGAVWEQTGPQVPYSKGQGTRHRRIYIRWLRDLP